MNRMEIEMLTDKELGNEINKTLILLRKQFNRKGLMYFKKLINEYERRYYNLLDDYKYLYSLKMIYYMYI